ncbi:MAG: MbnP family protein [Chitinophagaceae bacterium]
MKYYILFSVVFFSLFIACKKPTDKTLKSADVILKFTNVANGKAIVKDQMDYSNAFGSTFSISLLKYYVTNVVLVKDDGSEHKVANYDLIDAFDPAQFSTVDLADVPGGNYKTIRFYLGVDKSRNHNGAQDGDLDPINNMIWTWNTGYLFFKHEGSFKDINGATQMLQYHLGTDEALNTVTLPIDMEVNGTKRTVNIQFDLANMYDAPIIDFNNGAIRHSTSIDDVSWIQDMKSNQMNAFTILGVQ